MLSTEEFHTIKPKHKKIKEFISYYYFHSITEPNLKRKIVFYPNYDLAITIYRNSQLNFCENTSVTKHKQSNLYTHYYGGVRREFRISEMHSPFEKIGIVFNVLGLNHFIDYPLCEIITKNQDLSFPYFQKDMQSILEQVFEVKSMKKKVELLDGFFISKLTDFNNHLLENSVENILSSERSLKVKDLAQTVNVSTKTLNREFKKHLNCTVKDFLEVVQFRKAFNHYLSEKKSENLTKLAMEFDYYDQSEFINKFKKLTGINPKKLFSSVENFGDEKLFWRTT